LATGNSLLTFLPFHNEPPSTVYAVLDVLTAVTGVRPVLKFDPATDWFALFTGVMPRHYGGGGVTVTLWYAMDNSASGNVIWDLAFERVADGDLLVAAGSDFAAVQSVTDAADATANQIDPAVVTFTAGAQMDAVVAGDVFRLKVSRDANNAGDTHTGNALLVAVELKET